MRPALGLLVVLTALAAASSSASQNQPRVSVSVLPSTPAPSGGRSALGRRDWAVSFRVNVIADRECENLSVAYTYRTLFDGRRSLNGPVSESYDTGAPASSASFAVHADASAADLVVFRARGTCEQTDGTVLGASTPVAANVAVPAQSCDEGPLRVLFLRGQVRREDLLSTLRVPVRSGHYLWTGYRVWLAAGSGIVLGAPQCRALRITLFGPQSFVPGDYARSSYGTPTTLGPGGSADFQGDQHSGGVQTMDAIALPRGLRTAASTLARFSVVSLPGRLTRVHVKSGSVYIAGRRGPIAYSAAIVAHPGETVLVRCRSARVCAPVPARGSG
ncbi:MAG TPA: hypothetical protein VF002_04035 [Gaiellaceae bacterium]